MSYTQVNTPAKNILTEQPFYKQQGTISIILSPMDIASLFTIFCVGLSSWWAARHVDAWERDKWITSVLYTLVSIAVLFGVGLINKRLYLLILIMYFSLALNLELCIKSRFGHIWFAIFVGISGIFPIAFYQLFLE